MSQLTIDTVLDRVELNNKTFVEWAREYAREFCKTHYVVTIDDVRKAAEKYGLQPDSDKSWGCIFKGKEWGYSGMQKSTHPSNHGRRVSRWMLKP